MEPIDVVKLVHPVEPVADSVGLAEVLPVTGRNPQQYGQHIMLG